jgi:hypothetical protein
MPLSQAQLDAISKIDGGTAILDQIEADITETKSVLDKKITTLTRENVERKRTIQELKTSLHSAELDPDKPIAEQLAALQERMKADASKGMKPEGEVAILMKRLEKLEKDYQQEKSEKEQLKVQNHREKASAHFAPKLPDIFGKASSLILKNALVDGIITVDENGMPCVKNSDGEFLKDDDAINELRRIHSDLVITKQKPGSGDLPNSGGKGRGDTKTATRTEFEALTYEQKVKFGAEGGKIVEG